MSKVKDLTPINALRESSEAYEGEFVEKNEALTPENTIPSQEFAESTA